MHPRLLGALVAVTLVVASCSSGATADLGSGPAVDETEQEAPSALAVLVDDGLQGAADPAPDDAPDTMAESGVEAADEQPPANGLLGRSTITPQEATLLASMLQSPEGRALLVDILSADGILDLAQATCFVETADPSVIESLAAESSSSDLSVFASVTTACGIAPDALG